GALAGSATARVSGLASERFLPWQRRSIAIVSTVAASPYTVSVGKTTSCPLRNVCAAWSTTARISAVFCQARTCVMLSQEIKNRSEKGVPLNKWRKFYFTCVERGRQGSRHKLQSPTRFRVPDGQIA